MKYCLMICLLLTCSTLASAAELFMHKEVLVVELSGPLNTLIRHKKDEQEYPFVLSAGGIDHQIRVSARGNSRMELCDFPMLRFEFDPGVAEDSVFVGQKDLKLVSHCHQSDRAQANALKEYAAYQFFELLSDASYRTRLVQIKYKDTDGKHDMTRYGFLIESTNALAARISGERASLAAISLRSLDTLQAALVFVYQYMIGNTDWSLIAAENDEDCCHNGKLIKKDQQLYYVPYDFDLAGLVNARYARPDPSLSISRVTQRLYRGFCIDPEVLRDALEMVRSHEDEFRKIIAGLPVLPAKDVKKTGRFLDRFFNEAGDEVKMLKSFEKHCHE